MSKRPTGLKPAKPRKISGWSRSTGGRGCSGTVTSGLANFTGCGWSAKIQHQGVRRMISLGAVDQEVAAEKAAAILHRFSKAAGHRLAAARPAVPAVATGLESDDPRESADYWRLRLVERKYPANRLTKPEFSCASSTTVPAAISRSARSTRCRRRSRRWRCTGVSPAGAAPRPVQAELTWH